MINISQNQLLKTEGRGSFDYTAEISELQLAGFPREFLVDGLGNGQKFVPIADEFNDGDLMYVRYAQVCGFVKITIFND